MSLLSYESSSRKYWKNRAATTAERTSARRKRLRAFVDSYKSAKGCIDCGESDVRCLDLDHRPGTGKVAAISYMCVNTWSLDRIRAELAKCDVRCANCHRKITRLRTEFDSSE